MPGWILVSNHSSFPTTLDKKRVALAAFALAACLVMLTGCSNLRQQSLELQLPVLPSQAAVEANAISAPDLPLSEQDAVVADSSLVSNSALDSSAFENAFDEGFEQTPSVQSFLPSENDFQPPQPQARFVGVLDKAEMMEIKLQAVSNKPPPAPAIGTAANKTDLATCETHQACNHNATAQCDCCKKKQLPKLAMVEPVDPALLPELFGADRPPAKDNVSVDSMLQPLRSSNGATESKVASTTDADSSADTNSPIRLTAMQDSKTLSGRLPSTTTTIPAQTQNKAQLLIPIAPEVLSEFKAESKRAATDLAKSYPANPSIKVSPIMDVNSGLVKASSAAVTMATASEPVGPLADPNNIKAEFIPVSSSGIRVSAIPFKSHPAIKARHAKPEIKPAAEPTELVISKTIVEPTVTARSFEMATVNKVDTVSKVETFNPIATNNFQPAVSDANAFIAASRSTAERFLPALPKPTKTLPIPPANVPAAEKVFNKFPAIVKHAQPLRANPKPSTTNIDPLADLDDLPTMSQIEQELAEFKRGNTFDPSTIIKADTIDPALLLAKLDGPPKKIAAPIIKIVETVPDKDLITQQLAAQNSALLDLQDAIKHLKPEPVTVVHKEPKLTLNNAAFCTKISGFGQFTPFAANTFSGSQKTLLYCEVENQTSNQFTSVDGSQQFETTLLGSIVIYDANDQVVQTKKFPAIKDIARQQRRDFYVYFPVQFNELANGDYRLELNVEDITGNKTAALRPSMRFSVR